jgi:hypothetical protein
MICHGVRPQAGCGVDQESRSLRAMVSGEAGCTFGFGGEADQHVGLGKQPLTAFDFQHNLDIATVRITGCCSRRRLE